MAFTFKDGKLTKVDEEERQAAYSPSSPQSQAVRSGGGGKGSGKNMKTILNAQDRKIAGKTAQAQGLFFTGADYKEINLGLKDNATDPLSFLFS